MEGGCGNEENDIAVGGRMNIGRRKACSCLSKVHMEERF